MKGTLDVHCELLARDVPHEIVRLPKMVLSADELPDALGVAGRRCLAVRLFDVDGRLVGVLLPVDAIPDLVAVVAAVHGQTIAPLAPERVNAVTDYAAGLVAPLPLPADVTLVADSGLSALDAGAVYTPTGETGTALGIRPDALLAACRPRLADVARSPQPIPLPPDLPAIVPVGGRGGR